MKHSFKGAELSSLTREYLENNEWDIIELNCTVDPVKITEYYNEVKTRLQHLYFDFSMAHLLRPEITHKYQTENRVSNYIGPIGGWTVSWPVERDIPIPGQYQGSPEVYPELESCDFYFDATPLLVYKFGYMNTLIEKLTEAALRQMLIARHPPGLYVLTHVDSQKVKLHIPFETSDNAIFHFGDNAERKYHMDVGKLYLINPSVPHGTTNEGGMDRVHLLSRIDADYLPTILSMTGVL